MKIVKAVSPYHHPGFLNFKEGPYHAWEALGGKVAKAHYPWRFLHGLAYRWELPTLWKNKKEARLRFVQPYTISFDTYPDYARYEIIPFVWDCWPCHFEKMCAWLKKHNVRSAIFTSSQVADFIRTQFPQMNVLAITEGIKGENYKEGLLLREREIDILEYGRNTDRVVNYCLSHLKIVRGQKDGENLLTSEELYKYLKESKVVLAYPKNWTNPELAGNIETLTQRYWEGMLSRCVLVGHAPQELIDLVGYNPVIEVNLTDADGQLESIIQNIEKYQDLVDRNRKAALKYSGWEIRIKKIMEWLCSVGYYAKYVVKK